MRKVGLFILLAVFAALVPAAASAAPKASSLCQHIHDAVINQAVDEIFLQPVSESVGTSGMHSFQQQFHKLAGGQDFSGNAITHRQHYVVLSLRYALIEMFGNTRLTHNYPFHHFW